MIKNVFQLFTKVWIRWEILNTLLYFSFKIMVIRLPVSSNKQISGNSRFFSFFSNIHSKNVSYIFIFIIIVSNEIGNYFIVHAWWIYLPPPPKKQNFLKLMARIFLNYLFKPFLNKVNSLLGKFIIVIIHY